MEAPSIDLWGFTLRAPVTVGTNLLLFLQSAFASAALRRRHSPHVEWWAGFFVAMALATLAGVPKHGLSHLLDDQGLGAVRWVINLATGAAVFCAQRAALARWNDAAGRVAMRAAQLQGVLYLGANLAVGPTMGVLVVHTALGLLPVIAADTLAHSRGYRGAARVACGLAVSLFSGVAYVFGLSFGPWFNHVDIAHVFMGLSLYLIHRGVAESDTELGVGGVSRLSGGALAIAPPPTAANVAGGR